MKQTQQQIEKLKSLRESFDWAIDLAENQLPELKTALQEIKDKVSNITIDLSPVAKEETLNSSVAALSALIEGIPSKVAVTRVTDLVATENDKEYIANDYGVDGFGKVVVRVVLSRLVKPNSLRVTNNCIVDGYWAGELVDTSSVTNMSNMFYGCSQLQTLDVSNWDTSSTTSMRYMFYGCSQLQTLDISNWNTSSVTDILGMFYLCSQLQTLDISNWDTSSVTNMSSLFQDCNQLQALDVSNWDTSSVTSMQLMFSACHKLQTLVGNRTINDVLANNIGALNGLKIDLALNHTILDRASLRAVINGLADLTGQPAQTLTFGVGLVDKLTNEDIAIATNKNWTIA